MTGFGKHTNNVLSNYLERKTFHDWTLKQRKPGVRSPRQGRSCIRRAHHDSPEIYQALENSLALKAPPNVVVQFHYLENGYIFAMSQFT